MEDARVALLSQLIDHAPLFPPASLDMPEALEEDRRARQSSNSFMLGRFVCPVSRLSELPDMGCGISAVLDAPIPADSRLEAVETYPYFDPGSGIPNVSEIYVEVPLDEFVDDRLDHLAEFGLNAKVRCGGTSIPDTGALARFIGACRQRRLPFKATAGLHHAIASDGEHGFLNLLGAVVFDDAEAALSESDPQAFALDSEGFSWRERHAGPDQLARARRERLHSIGSCSFAEPVEELEKLRMLPL